MSGGFQRTCPADTSTKAECERTPNASWNETFGICVCCAVDGSSYADNGYCVACTGLNCGDKLYCKGAPLEYCTQNPSNYTWSTNAPTGSCRGNFNGSCGVAEYLGFTACQETSPGNYECKATANQGKSWAIYSFLIFAILVGIVYYFATHRVRLIELSKFFTPCDPKGEGSYYGRSRAIKEYPKPGVHYGS